MANIVLAHGILGFDQIGFLGFKVADYFKGVETALKGAGHSVLVPEVSTVGSVERRAGDFYDGVINHRERHPDFNSLIILAHSMGGLDARLALANHADLAELSHALVTIGTPHRGSPVADLVNNIFALPYHLFLRALGNSVGGLENLTVEFCERLDATLEPAPGVNYYSIAGDINSPNAARFFKQLGSFIRENNDGVVPHSSAAKQDMGWTNLPDWPADHMGLIGWFDPGTAAQAHAQHLARYLALVDRVARP
jgi:triacylglycerol lipase